MLAAAVGMDNQARRWLMLTDGPLQNLTRQFRRHAARHGPARQLARIQTQYAGQVQSAAASANTGHVWQPNHGQVPPFQTDDSAHCRIPAGYACCRQYGQTTLSHRFEQMNHIRLPTR